MIKNSSHSAAKRFLILLLGLVLIFGLTACGGSAGDTDGGSATKTEDNAKKSDEKKAALEDAEGEDDDADPATPPAPATGTTLESLYKEGNGFVVSFVDSVEVQAEGATCEVKGNRLIITMPIEDIGALSGDDVKASMDAYFADEEIEQTLASSLDLVEATTGVDGVTLTYRYLDEAGNLLYEITFPR